MTNDGASNYCRNCESLAKQLAASEARVRELESKAKYIASAVLEAADTRIEYYMPGSRVAIELACARAIRLVLEQRERGE